MASEQSIANDVIIAGSLCKRTKFTKKWKKFYWRLLANGQLCRFKDIKNIKLLGKVDIKRDCYDIREGLDASSKVTFPSYIPNSCCFSISLTDKSYYMYAETPASANEWVRALSSTSGVISRRRLETDTNFRELEKRRIAVRNARQRRSRRNRPDTISVDLVLECVEGELDHLEEIEDPYVTILPASPAADSKSQQHISTTSLLRRSTSVPNVLNSNNSNNNLTVNVTAVDVASTTGSMRSLYAENDPEEPLNSTQPPPIKLEDTLRERRNSFGEDHPTLQRNTLLRETRKAHKGYFASPQVTSITFKIAAVDDMHLCSSSVQDRQPVHKTLNTTGGSPTQSELSIGIVNISSPISPSNQHSCVASSNPYSKSPPVMPSANNGSFIPVRFASKVTHQKSLPESVAFSPPDSARNSFVHPVYPIPTQKPTFTNLNNSPVNNNFSTPAKHSTRMGPHQQSLPDFMMHPELSTTNPTPTSEKDIFSPPVVKRFTKSHQRCKSLSEFTITASVNNPESQKLHEVLGGVRPQSMAAHQAVMAELQLASKLA